MPHVLKFYESGDPSVTETILRSLPDWFGIEEAIKTYIKESKELPMLVTYHDDIPFGFISIKKHSPYTAEVYVMGVIPGHHRSGIGASLISETEKYLRGKGVEFLQVKTLDESRECEFYRKTRLFYKSVGFKEVEVFPTLWGEANPCLLLIKSIKKL